MSNHVHFILSAINHDLSDILRDFKKFTSKQITEAIENNRQESRRDWMLEIFRAQGEKIAGIRIINSGDKIINPRSCTALHLSFKR
jgi:hypothetical protein